MEFWDYPQITIRLPRPRRIQTRHNPVGTAEPGPAQGPVWSHDPVCNLAFLTIKNYIYNLKDSPFLYTLLYEKIVLNTPTPHPPPPKGSSSDPELGLDF